MWNIPSKERLAMIPGLYETEDISLQEKLIYLHFFIAGCDWYIAEFDGKELGGRPLRVNEAQERRPRTGAPPPRLDRPRFEGGGNRFGPDRPPFGGDRPNKPKGSRRGMRGKKRSL